MPSTAILLSANGDTSVHAYRPDEERTLCGLLLVYPEARSDDELPPYRSADITGRRYYIGLDRLMCARCTDAAMKARVEAGKVSIELPIRLVQ